MWNNLYFNIKLNMTKINKKEEIYIFFFFLDNKLHYSKNKYKVINNEPIINPIINNTLIEEI